jgi:hypothetical protein
MNNEQSHDPTVTLRLELGRVTDQRNAYEAALRKEVLAVIKEALADNTRLFNENAYLKSEVERLKNNCNYLDQKLDEEIERSASLAGEISRLTDAITAGAITPDAREVQS